MRGHLTADEHEWLGRDKSYDGVPARKGWIGTRFWFYPESIEIHAGEDDQSATIVRARYTADAERSRDDFNSDDDFERHRQAALLPSVRFVIDHLNANYEAYSAVFSELAELDTVARLVGICGWLAKRRPQWLDCDALLGVELPVSPTERERTRLITAALMMKSGAAASDEQNVISDSLAVNLSPLLDMPVREYFSSSADIGRCLGAEQATTPSGIAHSDSELLFTANADRPVREILRTHEDVERFASYASDRCEVPKSKAAVALLEPMAADKAVIARLDAVISAYSGEIGDLKSRVEGLDARLEELRKEAEGRFHESRGAAESFEQMNRERNQLIDRWNALAVQHNEALQQRREAADHWNQLVGQYNAMKFGAYRFASISGGIESSPKKMNIQVLASSRELLAFAEVQTHASSEYMELRNGEMWLNAPRHPNRPWRRANVEAILVRAKQIRRRRVEEGKGNWWVEVRDSQQQLSERRFDRKQRELRITESGGRGSPRVMIGRIDAAGRVIFRVEQPTPPAVRGIAALWPWLRRRQ